MRYLLLLLCLFGCSPQHGQERWRYAPEPSSPYQATLIGDDFNLGESQQFSLRIDAQPAEAGDNGRFFEGPIEAGGAINPPRPQLVWTSATDLLVTAHTKELEGQTTRRFGGNGRPRGSVTIRYVADGPISD